MHYPFGGRTLEESEAMTSIAPPPISVDRGEVHEGPGSELWQKGIEGLRMRQFEIGAIAHR